MTDFSQYIKLSKLELEKALKIACYRDNDFELMEFLLTSPLIKNKPDVHQSEAFTWACYCGYSEIVEFMLTSPALDKKANINAHNDYAFSIMCEKGHKDLLEFFLFSPLLSSRPNAILHQHYAFIQAASAGQIEIMKFFLTDTRLPFNIDIGYQNYKALKDVSEYHDVSQLKLLVNYLKNSDDIVHALENACKGYNSLDTLNYLYTFDSIKKELGLNPEKYLNASCYHQAPINKFRFLISCPEVIYNLDYQDHRFFKALAKSNREDIKQEFVNNFAYPANSDLREWLQDNKQFKPIKKMIHYMEKMDLKDRLGTELFIKSKDVMTKKIKI